MSISEDFKKSLIPIEGKKGLYRDERGHLHYLFSPPSRFQPQPPKERKATPGRTNYKNVPYPSEPGDKVCWDMFGSYGIVLPPKNPKYIQTHYSFVGKPENAPPGAKIVGAQWRPDNDCDYQHSVVASCDLIYLDKFPWE